MALSIQTNISAMQSQRSLNQSTNRLMVNQQRLSTGLRINSAKDDAAGLGISKRMTAQIRGLNQAVRNANDGVSLSQTAEGALQQTTDLLQRMRELAVQAASGTMTSDDRASVQNEVNQLMDEVNRISETTTYNGMRILDGSISTVSVQVGAASNESMDIGLRGVSAQDMSLNSYTALGDLNGGRIEVNTSGAFDTGTEIYNQVKLNGADIFASDSGYVLGTSSEADNIATSINSNTANHGVSANAYNIVTGSASASGETDGSLTITVGDDGTAQTVSKSDSMEELVENINKEVGGVTATMNSEGALVLSNETGESIELGGSQVAGTGIAEETYQGYVSLSSNDGSAIEITTNSSASSIEYIQDLGFNLSTGSQEASGTGVSSNAIVADDNLQINGVEVGKSNDASAASKAAAINDVTDQTGVKASGYTQVKLDLDFGELTYSSGQYFNNMNILINNTEISLTSSTASDLDNLVSEIDDQLQGVDASADSDTGKLVLTSETGLDLEIKDIFNDTAATGKDDSSYFGVSGVTYPSDFVTAATDQSGVEDGTDVDSAGTTFRGRIDLSSETGVDIRVSGDSSALTKIGFAEQGGSEEAIGSGLNVETTANANNAIDRIDDALDQINTFRGQLGAMQNRLDTTINNLENASQNLSEARSRIRDADIAKEAAEMTQNSVRRQAASAILAQANQQPQIALQLLGG